MKPSSQLKKDAENLLKNWNLLSFLSNFGEVFVVGSVYLDLMVWRDIDLEIASNSIPSRDVSMKIAEHLFAIKGFRKISIIDYIDSNDPNKPKGLYVGAEFIDDKQKNWKLDIRYLSNELANSHKTTQSVLAKLDDKKRNMILDIKTKVYDNPKYRKEVFSTDIYSAVIDGGIGDFESFKDYLKSNGKAEI